MPAKKPTKNTRPSSQGANDMKSRKRRASMGLKEKVDGGRRRTRRVTRRRKH